MEYEITKMITLSTAHISEETARKLERDIKHGTNYVPLPVFNKAEYGWFICISSYLEMLNEIELPEDLKACCLLATENDCEWLCLDCDGIIVPDLSIYEW